MCFFFCLHFPLKCSFLCFSLYLVEDDHLQLPYVNLAHVADCLWIPVQNSWTSIFDRTSLDKFVHLWAMYYEWKRLYCFSNFVDGQQFSERKCILQLCLWTFLGRGSIFDQNHRGGSCHSQATVQIKIK